MGLSFQPTGSACGARVTGVDLTEPLDQAAVAELRAAWLEHHVLVFPDQPIDDDDLERFVLAFGPFGHDPFFGPIPGREHIAAVRRDADETSPLFAENFHSDWSFQEKPPQGTVLRSVVTPPSGGDTLFANQHAAYEAMPAELRERIAGLRAIHSAKIPYSKEGTYGESDQDARSMDIRPSDEALAEYVHPLVLEHPESGRPAVFSTLGYIIGLEGMAPEEAMPLLKEVYDWQTREDVIYRHKWEPDMLVLWDNRSVLHAATGGYEGHDRLLHRTTIGAA
ncbi:MAG: TauD/TfdA dioxygenase family protein [Myxococcota bacterium]